MEYPNSISSKLPKVGTTIFSVMSQLANEHDAINLSQGFPDFPSDPKLIDLVHKYMKKGYNQYAPDGGVPVLKEVLSEKIKKLYGTTYHPQDEIIITPGATYGIFTAIMAFVKEGDEVVIFTPAYDCYAPAVELAGGNPIYVQLESPDFTVNWENVKKVVNSNTRMIIINTPHNPTGSMLTQEDMEQLENLTKESNIIILSDEVYEHITFDGNQHQSVARHPGLAERSLAVFSFGKTFHNTGWKIGYVIGPGNLMAEFRKVHQFNVFTTHTPTQYALADYLQKEEHYLSLPDFYQEKRDMFLEQIEGSNFIVKPASGTYFQVLGYENITDEADTEYAIRLTKDIGVACIPVSVFYSQPTDNKVLRFCFAKKDETLKKAGRILCKI